MSAHKWGLRRPIDPAKLPTAQQKGVRAVQINGHAVAMHYTKRKVEKAGHWLLSEIRKNMASRPAPENHDGVWFFSAFYYYHPKSLTKKMLGTYKLTRPDGDNLSKLVLDVLTESGFFWADDAQVQIRAIDRKYVSSFDEEAHVVLMIERGERNDC